MQVPVTMEEAIADIESRFECRDGPACALAPTGERYVTLVIGGIRKECEPFPVVYDADKHDAAVVAWWHSFNEYAESRPGARLYWRERPEVGPPNDKRPRGRPLRPEARVCTAKVVVYSRLLITDKPELSKEVN